MMATRNMQQLLAAIKADGGVVFPSSAVSHGDIADAQESTNWYVDDNGYGYLLFPLRLYTDLKEISEAEHELLAWYEEDTNRCYADQSQIPDELRQLEEKLTAAQQVRARPEDHRKEARSEDKPERWCKNQGSGKWGKWKCLAISGSRLPDTCPYDDVNESRICSYLTAMTAETKTPQTEP